LLNYSAGELNEFIAAMLNPVPLSKCIEAALRTILVSQTQFDSTEPYSVAALDAVKRLSEWGVLVREGRRLEVKNAFASCLRIKCVRRDKVGSVYTYISHSTTLGILRYLDKCDVKRNESKCLTDILKARVKCLKCRRCILKIFRIPVV
jgi:hypothetical protein